jgi:hypothetical protein
MSQRELTHQEVEDETPVDKVLEEAEKWAAMTFDKQAGHHEKHQASCSQQGKHRTTDLTGEGDKRHCARTTTP